MEMVEHGTTRRACSATAANAQSSRSHAVCTFTLRRRPAGASFTHARIHRAGMALVGRVASASVDAIVADSAITAASALLYPLRAPLKSRLECHPHRTEAQMHWAAQAWRARCLLYAQGAASGVLSSASSRSSISPGASAAPTRATRARRPGSAATKPTNSRPKADPPAPLPFRPTHTPPSACRRALVAPVMPASARVRPRSATPARRSRAMGVHVVGVLTFEQRSEAAGEKAQRSTRACWRSKSASGLSRCRAHTLPSVAPS